MDPTVYALGKKVRAYCDVLSEYPSATKSSIEQQKALNNLDSSMGKKTSNHNEISIGEPPPDS
jgi:hypothetical protein